MSRVESEGDQPARSDDIPVASSHPSELRAVYNVTTDLVTGVNVRLSDNLFQAKVIGICAACFAVMAAIAVFISGTTEIPWWVASLLGAFAGVVVGLFVSGIYLMFYRLSRHAAGKHD